MQENSSAFAWSESLLRREIGYFIDYLLDMGFLSARNQGDNFPCGEFLIPTGVRVTVEGHNQIEQQKTNVDSSQAFVAMWFDDSMEDVFETGIRPAIAEVGYSPLRIDKKDHINKIDDEIIAELRRSRFLVADFTHGNDGARGGVYYEAGFAHGLGLPVIFTCRKDAVESLHFDTNHYSHVVWSDPSELRDKLRTRILAVLGQGPGSHTAP